MRTPEQVLGPYFPVGSEPARGGDLISSSGHKAPPAGELIEVVGCVLNSDGRPVRGATLVFWQANSFGRYAHPNDANTAPLDPNFRGFGEIRSSHDGRSEEHTSELQSLRHLVCRLLLEKKK